MAAHDSTTILEALSEEADLCTELAGLREEQRRLIEAGEAEQLLGVLARKQSTIARITTLEDELRPVKSQWADQRDRFAPDRRIAIGDAFRRVQGLLEDLIAKETEDAERLAARTKEAATEVDAFDQKRRVESAYRAAAGHVAPAGSRYIDRNDA